MSPTNLDSPPPLLVVSLPRHVTNVYGFPGNREEGWISGKMGGGRRGAVGWMPEEGAALCCHFTSCITGCSTSLPALHHLRRLICLKAPCGEQQSWKRQTWFSCSVCPFWIEGCKRRIHAGGVWTVVHHNALSVSEFSHEGRTQGVDSRPGACRSPRRSTSLATLQHLLYFIFCVYSVRCRQLCNNQINPNAFNFPWRSARCEWILCWPNTKLVKSYPIHVVASSPCITASVSHKKINTGV